MRGLRNGYGPGAGKHRCQERHLQHFEPAVGRVRAQVRDLPVGPVGPGRIASKAHLPQPRRVPPPSTGREIPVINRAESEHNQRAASA
jgi:hypothetical protein